MAKTGPQANGRVASAALYVEHKISSQGGQADGF